MIAALVHYLLELDLTQFRVRKRPQTTEHLEQKLKSLNGFHRYWFEVLRLGSFPPLTELGFSQPWIEPQFVSTENFMKGWKLHERGGKQFEAQQSRELHQTLKKLCPSAKSARIQLQGVHSRGYSLPSLPVAREEFAKMIGGEVDWND